MTDIETPPGCPHNDPSCMPGWECESCVEDELRLNGKPEDLARFLRMKPPTAIAERKNEITLEHDYASFPILKIQDTKEKTTFTLVDHSVEAKVEAGGPSLKQAAFINKLSKQKNFTIEAAISTKKEASDMIEKLLALPEPTGGPLVGRWGKMGAEFYIKVPAGQKAPGDVITVEKANGQQQPNTVLGKLHATQGGFDYFVKGFAGQKPGETPQYESGKLYKTESGTIVRIKQGANGNFWGKILDPETGKFEYAPGITNQALTILTLEEAQAFGHTHGICANCGAELSDPESVSKGLGPICFSKWG